MTQSTKTLYRSYIIEEYHFTEEPYYKAVGDEVELFEAAYQQKIPLIFKGPTSVDASDMNAARSSPISGNIS